MALSSDHRRPPSMSAAAAAWARAASVVVDRDGRYLDANGAALELLGVATVEALRGIAPSTFAALPPDPVEQEAWRKAYYSSRAEAVLAEGAFRRLDGELVRVRTAIVEEADGTFRALFYAVERPTKNVAAKVYKIADVLSEWRAAERKLVALDPAADEAQRLAAEIEVLREQYQALFAQARRRARA